LGGVLSRLSVDRFDVGSKVQGDFILQHSLWDKELEFKWTLMNVYGANHDENKESFLVELASMCANNKNPLLIGGDLNILTRFGTMSTMSPRLGRKEQGGGVAMSRPTRPKDTGQEAHN
jgi:hypothetical protein